MKQASIQLLFFTLVPALSANTILWPNDQRFFLTQVERVYIFTKSDIKDAMREFLKVMKAAGDPSRVKIMKMLARKSMCVCEIQTALGTAQSTASKHLKILEEAGLVISRKDGLWVNYTLADGRQNAYAANLLGNMRHWLNDDPEILSLLNKLKGINRYKILDKN